MTGDHYFSTEPSTAEQRREIEFSVAGRDYRFSSAGGVFSAARLDAGTAVLLRKADLPDAAEPGPLLDIGCGYGPIACVLATEAPAATVWAVDVNARARQLTVVNAERSGAGRAGPGQRARRRTGGGELRPDLVQPADPHRQGRAARTARPLAAPARPRWHRLAGRRPAPRRRLAARAGWSSRAGRSTGTPARRATGCCGSPTRKAVASAQPTRAPLPLWDMWTWQGSGTSCPTAGNSSPMCRSGSVRGRRWRWSARTGPARRPC